MNRGAADSVAVKICALLDKISHFDKDERYMAVFGERVRGTNSKQSNYGGRFTAELMFMDHAHPARLTKRAAKRSETRSQSRKAHLLGNP
jgi:hypothetical protein